MHEGAARDEGAGGEHTKGGDAAPTGAGGATRWGPWGLLAALAAVGTWVGWKAFWFLCDDAYITFRYVSNAMLGRGLVWNPAPFVPVEGYTSFLWTVFLLAVWKVTGLEPPAIANTLSLGFGLVTLGLVTYTLATVRLPAAYERARVPLAALVLLATVTNRTFLAWLSSGLETAMFNCFITVWLVTMARAHTDRRALWGATVSAALLALTRPDGELFAGATAALVAATVYLRRNTLREALPTLAPLAVIPAHLTFRWVTYHELVPNTYFAKHLGAWPEAGVRYFAAFALEYAVWVWALALAAAVRPLREAVRAAGARPFAERHLGVMVAVAAVLAQVGYYTLIIGGDHFEFRVYSHLVPWIFATAALALASRMKRPTEALAVMGLFVALSWPIPWVHWVKSRTLTTREQTHYMVVRVADDLPLPLRPFGLAWDSLEAWLLPRLDGTRHQEHKVFIAALLDEFPTREEGARVPWSDRGTTMGGAVGLVAWVLPNVAVIDSLGLNDRVVAHNPPQPGHHRVMAHERRAPPGYLECFRLNVLPGGGRIYGTRRAFTDDDIRNCERTFARRVGIEVR